MKNKTIKIKIEELTKIIEWFDSSDFELEEALGKFEEAKKLADDIEISLKEMKNKVEVIKKDFSKADE